MRRISRKPYLEGSDLFMHEDPTNVSSNPYTNVGFGLIKNGIYNKSYGLYENSRAEILYNDNRESEIRMLMMQALGG